MKKIKYLVMAFMIFLLSGCMNVSMDITINNDDTGKIEYTVGYEESFYESSEVEMDNNIKDTIPEAKVENINYQKGDKTYIGQKATINFDSIDELNEVITKMNESTENEEEDEETSDVSTPSLKAVREGDKVKITLPADQTSYEQTKMYLSYIDYSLNIKVDGKVLNHNANKVEEATNTYIWTVSTMLQEGIIFEYQTGHNYLVLSIIGGLVLIIIGLVIVNIKTFIKKK